MTYTGIIPRQASLARYKDGTHVIRLEFPYNPDDVAAVKRIPGRKWNPDARIWTCPPTGKALQILEEARFLIDPGVKDLVRDAKRRAKSIEVPGLKQELFQYQKQGVAFLQSVNGRGLVGDDMGLGKTVQAIAWLHLNREKRPVVIVCPASVKLNWAKEIREWIPGGRDMVQILHGTTPYALEREILIINFDILFAWLPAIRAYRPMVAIIDEVQYVKSGKARRTKAVRALSKMVPHFMALSGTAIVNRPIEFFEILRMIKADLFPNWMTYTERYCARKNNGFGWDVSGASNTQELHEIVTDSVMIRRTKAEVLKDLPAKIRSFVPIEMDPALESNYYEAERNFLRWLRKTKGEAAWRRAQYAETLTAIEAFKQAAVDAKLDNAMDWIQDFLESDEKLVVFAGHRFVIDELMQRFKDRAVKIDGGVSSTNRQLAVERFANEPKKRLFVGQIDAAGVGINLTAASNVAFLELPWTPGALNQAEDRCHRIGQKDTVNVYYLLAENTIEERIAALLDQKRRILDAVLDGKETADVNLLMELIENYD